ncbi:MAG TPA: hypothetical protein VMW17_08240 [Candidatus Binatia bacterium]|nr:hypothetical protein [Candidatus Binatia bacterium]
MSRPAASLALPIGVFLLVLGWWNYSQIGIAFNVLGGAALAYGASPHLDRLFRAPATRGRDQR